jgi:hypothetical protein
MSASAPVKRKAHLRSDVGAQRCLEAANTLQHTMQRHTSINRMLLKCVATAMRFTRLLLLLGRMYKGDRAQSTSVGMEFAEI